MRSLPEKDFWDSLRTRLRNYEEQPPKDDWELIAAALKPSRPWYKRRRVAVLALLLLISGTAVWVMLPSGKETRNNSLSENTTGHNTSPSSADAASIDTAGQERSSNEAATSSTSNEGTSHAITGDKVAAGNEHVHSNNNIAPLKSGAATTQGASAAHASDHNNKSSDAHANKQSSQRAIGSSETTSASRVHTSSADDKRSLAEKQRIASTQGLANKQDLAEQRSVAQKQSPADTHNLAQNHDAAQTQDRTARHSLNGNDTSAPETSQSIDRSGRADNVTPVGAEPHNASSASYTKPGTRTADDRPRTDDKATSDHQPKSADGKQDTNATAGNNVNPVASGTTATMNTATTADTLSPASPTALGNLSRREDDHTDEQVAASGAIASATPEKDSALVKDTDKKQGAATKAKEQEQNRRDWQPTLYFSLTPSLAFQKVSPMRNDDIHISGLQEESMISGNRTGISLETGAQITIVKGFDLYAGLAYYQQSQSITYNYTVPSTTHINSSESMDYVITPDGGTHTFRYAMRNAGVSAGFLYTVKDAKLMHKIGAGLQYQRGFMTARSGDTYQNRGAQYLNYQVHYRLEWATARAARTHLFVQPAFIHSFWSHETLREPLTLKPYRVGLTFGVNFTF